MENFKLNLDRPKLSSEQINARQDFGQVLNKFKASNPPIYKNPWFWGSAGLASVGLATMISLNALSNQKEKHDNITTQSKIDLPKDTECIKPPVKNEDIPFNTFVVDPSKDEKITLESGTTIDIQKGSLESSKPVEIQVREFRDKASACVAGIPMDYGKNNAFESAGMIEIRGVQDDKVVDINPEKPIEISLKTTQDPTDFAFWKLDEKSGEWKNHPVKKIMAQKKAENAAVASGNKHSAKKIAALETRIADKTLVLTESKTALNKLEKPVAADFKVATEGKQRFDLDFNKEEYPELAKFKNLVFEVVPTEGYDKSFTKKNWSNVELNKQKDRYIMRFESPSEKDFTIEVTPVLEGKEAVKAEKEFEEAIVDYKSTKAELEKKIKETEAKKKAEEAELRKLINNSTQEQEQIPIKKSGYDSFQGETVKQQKIADSRTDINQANSAVSFRTTTWGLFNSDNPVPYPEPLAEEIPMLLGGHSTQYEVLYVFNLKKNVRYTYDKYAISLFGMHKSDDLVILGVNNEGKIGYLELKDRKKGEVFPVLDLKPKEASIKTLDLLKTLLNENAVPA